MTWTPRPARRDPDRLGRRVRPQAAHHGAQRRPRALAALLLRRPGRRRHRRRQVRPAPPTAGPPTRPATRSVPTTSAPRSSTRSASTRRPRSAIPSAGRFGSTPAAPDDACSPDFTVSPVKFAIGHRLALPTHGSIRLTRFPRDSLRLPGARASSHSQDASNLVTPLRRGDPLHCPALAARCLHLHPRGGFLQSDEGPTRPGARVSRRSPESSRPRSFGWGVSVPQASGGGTATRRSTRSAPKGAFRAGGRSASTEQTEGSTGRGIAPRVRARGS